MKSLRILAAALALTLAVPSLAPSPALAHGRDIGPHGGLQVHAGPLHAELVVQDRTVTVYVYTIKDEPIAMDGGTGTATVLAGGKTERIELKPAGGNAIAGTGTFTPTDDMRVVVSVTPPGQSAVSARYDLSKLKKAGS